MTFELTVDKFYTTYIEMCDYRNIPLSDRLSKTEYIKKTDELLKRDRK